MTVIETNSPTGSGALKSGPIQIGGDWPGVFIRGDEASGLAHMLRWLISAHEATSGKRLTAFNEFLSWVDASAVREKSDAG